MEDASQIADQGCAADPHLSVAEISAALSALSDDDKIRLRLVGSWLAEGTGEEMADLLQETVVRALAGTRRCPRDVPFVQFLIGSMRSIASQQRDNAKAHPHESLVSELQREGSDLEEKEYPDPGPSPEEIAMTGEEPDPIDVIEAGFADDYEAQLLIEGWCDGLRGKPLRELTGLDQAALDYKAKFVRRRIKALYPQGWTP